MPPHAATHTPSPQTPCASWWAQSQTNPPTTLRCVARALLLSPTAAARVFEYHQDMPQDRSLRAAAQLLQDALSATTVEQEEALW